MSHSTRGKGSISPNEFHVLVLDYVGRYKTGVHNVVALRDELKNLIERYERFETEVAQSFNNYMEDGDVPDDADPVMWNNSEFTTSFDPRDGSYFPDADQEFPQ